VTRARAWFCLPRAAADAGAIVTEFSRSKGGPTLARKFVASLETSLDRLVEQPDAGPRFDSALHRLRDARIWPVHSHPVCLVYYQVGDRIEIVRIVQASRESPGASRRNR
jgi:plasmid stabilization system protein ParE